MPRIQYYVAASLDGFIATPTDDLGWLLQFDGFEGGKESYETFMADVGCIVMGGGTYAWLLEHEPGNWPYQGTPSYVFTHHEYTAPAGSNTTFVRGEITEFLPDLEQAAGGKNIWVVGGGNLAAQFASAGLLDELILSVIPVVLGDGKRLLPLAGPTPPLELAASRTMGRGIVELRYLLNGHAAS
ncbi:dihydrofolate reductase [Arthrobacter sp. BB-1]|uniref:dihydrofolate reductase family protein n=1 Tax=unclassified Arthrobacter TaxID=235627 RepID=UPI00111286F2|nr:MULTISPECIES: dihydrofolate reductase family protein [unclassified Arthrobacter]TNB72561.1 dihydrofolate reductase [Arthrobacter sp. BB-1]